MAESSKSSGNIRAVPLKPKEGIVPPGTSTCSTESVSVKSTCLPLPIAQKAREGPPKANSIQSSESIVLVLPRTSQQSNSFRNIQPKALGTTHSLQERSLSSQDTKVKNLKEMYFIQKGRALSQLKKIKLITANKINPSSSQKTPGLEDKTFSHFKNINLRSGNKTLLMDTPGTNNCQLDFTTEQQTKEPSSTGSLAATELGVHKIESNKSTNNVADSPQKSVTIVTVGRDGIIHASSSKLPVTSAMQLSVQGNDVLSKKFSCLQYQQGDKEVDSGLVHISPSRLRCSATLSQLSKTVSQRQAIASSNNGHSHQVTSILPRYVQQSGTVGLPVASSLLQPMESTSIASSVPQIVFPMASGQFTARKTLAGQTTTASVNSLAQPIVFSIKPPANNPASLKSLLEQKTAGSTQSPSLHSNQKKQIYRYIVPKILQGSGTDVMRPETSILRGTVKGLMPTTKSKLESYILEKVGQNMTNNKSLLVNNNVVVSEDKNGNTSEHVYFTTLRTGNGQVAVKVIQPNFDDETDVDGQMPVSSVNAVKNLYWGPNDEVIKNSFENQDSKQQVINNSNLPTPKEQQGDEQQKRIKKSAKLEKVVANILRSHRIDENTFLKATGSVDSLICADSAVTFSSEGGRIQKATTTSEATSQDKEEDTESTGEDEMNLKISSVFYLNPDSHRVVRLSDEEEVEDCWTYKLGDPSTWKEVVTPCYVVVERLTICKNDPSGVAQTQSQCSEHCRNRTLEYMCHLKLLDCEDISNENKHSHDNDVSLSLNSVINKNLPNGQPTEDPVTKITGQIQPDQNSCQLQKMTENHYFDLKSSLAEVSAVINNATNDPKSDCNSKSKISDVNAISTVRKTHTISTVSKLVRKTDSISISTNKNDLTNPVQQPNIQISPELDRQVVSVRMPSQMSAEKQVVLENPVATSKQSPTRKPLISLLSPSLFTPKTVDKTPIDMLPSPEGSASKRNIDPKEFQKLLTELKDQVEKKRQEMNKLHRLKKRRRSRANRNKGVAKGVQIEDKEMKVALPFTAKASPNTSKPGPLAQPGMNVLENQQSSSLLSSPKIFKNCKSKTKPNPSDKLLNCSITGEPKKLIPPEKIKEAIESLSKYLRATGTKITSDNNKYFLLKVENQHVLVKIPHDFPSADSLDLVASEASTSKHVAATSKHVASEVPTSKHVSIQPKPATDLSLQPIQLPGFRAILPQSQRSVTLMARVNKNKIGDHANKSSEISNPLVTKDANLGKVMAASVPNSTDKVDLSHLPPNSSLLPQRRKRHTNLTDEEKKAKRAKLEAKYPLPPGVIIKSEPDDQTDYAIDDNWTVTSEFLTTASNSGSAESGLAETPMEYDNAVAGKHIPEARHDGVQRAGHFVGRHVADESDEPPTLLSAASVSPEGVVDRQVDSEVGDETPPLLQPMLPVLSPATDDHTSEPEYSFGPPVTIVSSLTSVSSRESGYVSDSNKSTATTNQTPAYKNSKIERLKELLKKKEMEIEALRKMRPAMPKL